MPPERRFLFCQCSSINAPNVSRSVRDMRRDGALNENVTAIACSGSIPGLAVMIHRVRKATAAKKSSATERLTCTPTIQRRPRVCVGRPESCPDTPSVRLVRKASRSGARAASSPTPAQTTAVNISARASCGTCSATARPARNWPPPKLWLRSQTEKCLTLCPWQQKFFRLQAQ